MEEKQVKVSLWCVPRSLSTVLTKCLGAIDGMEVYFELFSHAVAASNAFESVVGRKLPFQLEGTEKDYEYMSKIWDTVSADRKLISRRISCLDIKHDLQNASSKYVVNKEMAYTVDHVKDYLPRGFRYVFITREPSRVFASYRKRVQASAPLIQESEQSKHASERMLDIIRDDAASVRPKSWYEKQHQLWKYVREHIDPNPIVIDAFDLASEPQNILRAFCNDVGFPYSDDLLRWNPSRDFPKNFVAPLENMSEGMGAQLYASALNSATFVAPRELYGPIPRDQLTNDVIQCIDHSMPFYREMYENRLRPSSIQ